MDARPAIYLHSTWRCGSTYAWAKFRDLPGHYCFFEPLNEHLANADPDFVDRFRPWSYANHPTLVRPYLDEFRPLLAPRGGINAFPEAFTFGSYRLDPAEERPELASYFETLERFARDRSLTPVFGCVRTDLRVGWFRANLPGVHIALRRDPRRQFLSCLAQGAHGNPYFLQRGLIILENNRDDPFFAPVRRIVDLQRIGEALRQTASQSCEPCWSELYKISYFLHRLACAEAAHADLILDMDRISTEGTEAQAAETAVKSLTGVNLSFADCKIKRYEPQLSWANPVFAAIEAQIDDLFDHEARLAA